MALEIEKEGLIASPNDSSVDTSPNHAETRVVTSNVGENEAQETVESLTEKLSAALLSISAKEDLVKQHSKVAEEAVSGWEKAETDVAVLKQQLEATSQKNAALENRVNHLDGALKECVRQLRQLRDEQEQKVHDAITKKTQEWESNKSELENQLIELRARLETSKAETGTILVDSRSKLEAIENENVALKAKLLTQSEELKIRTLERELSTQAAETASKQHLESIKKVAKLEAECRKLKALARKTSPVNDYKTISSSACAESLTDSQSDNGDRSLGVDNELSGSDSWASALIAELDQFKNEKTGMKVLTTSVNIDLMDDFLEMERLAAIPETDPGSSAFALEADSDRMAGRDSPSKVEDEAAKQIAELEEKVEKLEMEKAKLEIALGDNQNKFEISCNQLTIAEGKLVQLQKELELAKESKQAAMEEASSSHAKTKVLESRLESTLLKVSKLQYKVASLEGKPEESALSSELRTKLKASEETREAVESQLHLAYIEIEKLHEEVGLLEGKIVEERALSVELTAKVDTMEATRQAMESQYLSADMKARNLQEKVNLLEARIEDERLLSTELAAKIEAVEGQRKALEYDLVLSRSEVRKLSDKVDLLEEEVDKERTLSTQFAVKCKNLEDELLRKRQEAELRAVSCSNGDLTLKQEKELVVAAEKLAECQKTIASLGQQLKSLTTLDQFMLDTEKPELNGGSPSHRSGTSKTLSTSDTLGDAGGCTRSNGKERGSPSSPASSTSKLSGFGRLSSRSRSSSRIENQ